MTRRIDVETGIMGFRQSGSLCVRVRGRLDGTMARGVERIISEERDAVRVRLECSALMDVEPVGARLLSHALLRWITEGDGRSVDLLNLDPALQRRVAWHPLRVFVDPDELVFFDPGRDGGAEITPSRH
ncbi:MAG TPA: hypothetical protein VK966_03480 [Longimicrobiales bacterium]|nr:hypothetical protein [Longimicrobiales bacterium]